MNTMGFFRRFSAWCLLAVLFANAPLSIAGDVTASPPCQNDLLHLPLLV